MANLFDAANAPTSIPDSIVVGDFSQFKLTQYSSDYSNSAHTMRLVARISTGGSTELTVTATASGDDYLFTINSSTSASYTVGHYHYQIEIERNSDNERIIVDRGEFDILTDYDNNVDARTHGEIMLQKIEAILEGKADADVSSYSINGRSLNKFSPDELVKWRDYYKAEVAAHKRKERIKHGKGAGFTILGRF